MEERINSLDTLIRELQNKIVELQIRVERVPELDKKISEANKRLDTYDRARYFVAALALVFGVSGSFVWTQLQEANDQIKLLTDDANTIKVQFSALNERYAQLDSQAQELGGKIDDLTEDVDRSVREIADVKDRGITQLQEQVSILTAESQDELRAHVTLLQANFSPVSNVDSTQLTDAFTRLTELENGLANGDFYIKARGISIIDDASNELITLSTASKNSAYLTFNTTDSTARLKLGSTEGKFPILRMWNEYNNEIGYFGATTGANGVLTLESADNSYEQYVGFSSEDEPLWNWKMGDEKYWELAIYGDNQAPQMNFFMPSNDEKMSLGITSNGLEPYLYFTELDTDNSLFFLYEELVETDKLTRSSQ